MGHLTFQVLTLPLMEGKRECNNAMEFQSMGGIAHVSDKPHQSFHDQALIFYISSPTLL